MTHTVSGAVSALAGGCALVAGLSVIGNAGVSEACGAVAVVASGVQAATGAINYGTGREKGGQFALDVGSFGVAGVGQGLSVAANAMKEAAQGWGEADAGASAFRGFLYSTRATMGEALGQGLMIDTYLIGVPSTAWGFWSTYDSIAPYLESCQ